jgi:hypothetical protein
MHSRCKYAKIHTFLNVVVWTIKTMLIATPYNKTAIRPSMIVRPIEVARQEHVEPDAKAIALVTMENHLVEKIVMLTHKLKRVTHGKSIYQDVQ